MVQELGLDALRQLKAVGDFGAFENTFTELLRGLGSGAAIQERPLEEEAVTEDLHDEVEVELEGFPLQQEELTWLPDELEAEQPGLGQQRFRARGARRAELEAVCKYLAQQPEARVWLVDRDARLNQPRVEAWAQAERALSFGIETMPVALDAKGRTTTTQTVSMQSPANQRLVKRVLAVEREEFIVGALQERLAFWDPARASSSALSSDLVVLLLGATHLEGLIRRWFEPPPAQRLAELCEDHGLAALQSPDMLEIALRVETTWEGVLERLDFFASAPRRSGAPPAVGDYEVFVAVEAVRDCCKGQPDAAKALVTSPRWGEFRGAVEAITSESLALPAQEALGELLKWAQ